eukprot:s456_g19.t1
MASPAGSQAMSLEALATNAGAGPTIVEYLNLRGIKTTPTLALISTSRDEFLLQVVQPLLDGYQKGATRLVIEAEEKPIAQAVMEHMWQEAQLQWQQRLAMAPLAGATVPTAPPSTTGTAATSTSTEKIPKQLPAQVWQKQIGEEDHIHTFGDWFIQKVRGRPHKLENLRAFWDAAGWKIAMGMRAGQSFGEITVEEPGLTGNNNSKGAKGNQKGKYQNQGHYNQRLAMEWLAGPPRMFMAWETDEECQQITSCRFPEVIHRGCFIKDNYEEVVQMIKKVDPNEECTIVVTAGTPCPSYSVVSGLTEGRSEPEGSKFTTFVERLSDLEKALPGHTFLVLAENVVMNDPSDAKFISEKIGSEPIVLDAADSSMVSRPRLWWTRLQWQDIKVHPLTDHRLQWSQHNRYRKLKLDLPSPKKHKLKTSEAAQRWDARQFAPWQYNDHAMAWRGSEAVVIPPDLKEQLHGMPRGGQGCPTSHIDPDIECWPMDGTCTQHWWPWPSCCRL